MAVIPTFFDWAPFVFRSFTATDFFAAFPDFAAFFFVLAICSPDADASAILAQSVGPQDRSLRPRDARVP